MKYIITIYLKSHSVLNRTDMMPYYMSGAKMDSVEFSANYIKLVANRNKKYTEDDIFFNVQNSLYNQMYKCLLFHYAMNGSNSQIEKIAIDVHSSVNLIEQYEYNFNAENQPFPLYTPTIGFNENSLEMLLDESDDSFQFRIIMAHWMSAVQNNDRLGKLECLWRTFERLCAYHCHRPAGEHPLIANGLKLMINELTSNPQYYSVSASFVHSYTYEYLRSFLWHDMIENNYKKRAGIDKYRDYVNYLVYTFEDKRIMNLMLDVRCYRKQELNSYSLYVPMKVYCQSKIALGLLKDIDVVALLCCHYAYYLRNRLLHGQSLVKCSIFNQNIDSMRLDVVSSLLELLNVELINNIRNL